MNEKHVELDQTYNCSKCDKEFKYKHSVKNHMESHSGMNQIILPYCHYHFGMDQIIL